MSEGEKKSKAPWAPARQEALALITAVQKDQVEALERASDRALWAADAIAAEKAGEAAKWGLAALAARTGASQCVDFLLGCEGWLAGRVVSMEHFAEVETHLAALGAQSQAAKTLEGLSLRSPRLAWMGAALCAPGEPWTGRHGYKLDTVRFGQREKENQNPGKEFVSGFVAAASGALSHGVPEGEARELAREALSRALEEEWVYCAWSVAAPNIAGAALDAGLVDERVGLAAANGAAKISNASMSKDEGQAMWDLAERFARELGMAVQCSPKALGEKAGWRKLSVASYRSDGPMVEFPERMDPAWAAAALAKDAKEGALAVKMASKAGRLEVWPQCEADIKGESHPLMAAWEVWNHSRKAGFALPKKALGFARKKTDAALASAKRWAPPSAWSTWSDTAQACLRALEAGRVDPSFGSYGQEPPTMARSKALGEVQDHLTPLAWAMARSGGREFSPERFAAVAAAQSALGFTLESSLGQLSMIGVAPPRPDVLAQAEAEIVRVASMAPASARLGTRARL